MTQRTVPRFLLLEGATFAVAALIHFGVVPSGYEHWRAGVAESVIATVLVGSFLLTLVRPSWTRRVGLSAQLFALVGTLVGVFTIVVGVGPRTVPDVVYHAAIVAVLAWGVAVAGRAPTHGERQHA